MQTVHKLIIGNAITTKEIDDESVHLMLTSPLSFNGQEDKIDIDDFKKVNDS